MLFDIFPHSKHNRICAWLIIVMLIALTGCEPKHEAYVSTSTTIRDNTPRCLTPSAPGDITWGNELVTIDASNASEGYIMVTYLGDAKGTKLQITGPDYMTYTYDLFDNNPETFPISAGNGLYSIGLFENIEGNQYSTIFMEEHEFNIENELGAFLYPNQYVKFTKDSNVVSMARELVAPAHDDLEAINYVYNYVVDTIKYDTPKAERAESGYIPDVDQILDSKIGICIDYAAVMTSMLRSQGIPTRMEIGYAGQAYHAWISTYAENIGWINGIVEFDGQNWSLMDPTVAANQGEKALKTFIGNGDTYLTKFIY